ncbi:hypothetical protein BDQ17DRAFT_1426059 [Cyathus striatus]|nr:hypothetical protein BDQ17DRAFT_1426059 [Cyathus striatus]
MATLVGSIHGLVREKNTDVAHIMAGFGVTAAIIGVILYVMKLFGKWETAGWAGRIILTNISRCYRKTYAIHVRVPVATDVDVVGLLLVVHKAPAAAIHTDEPVYTMSNESLNRHVKVHPPSCALESLQSDVFLGLLLPREEEEHALEDDIGVTLITQEGGYALGVKAGVALMSLSIHGGDVNAQEEEEHAVFEPIFIPNICE